jgi:hypothetical protein
MAAVEEPKGREARELVLYVCSDQLFNVKLRGTEYHEANHPETGIWRGCQRSGTADAGLCGRKAEPVSSQLVALRYAKLVLARFPDKHRVARYGEKPQLRRIIVHALALLTILARCGLALDPTQPAGSYIRTAFTVEDGASIECCERHSSNPEWILVDRNGRRTGALRRPAFYND